MTSTSLRGLLAAGLAALLTAVHPVVRAADVLPSWNDGAAKARTVAFVRAVTDPGSKDFVAPAERIAVFDNDGTLWAEQPVYFQALFIRDRIQALAPKNPAWKTQEPYPYCVTRVALR